MHGSVSIIIIIFHEEHRIKWCLNTMVTSFSVLTRAYIIFEAITVVHNKRVKDVREALY